MSDKQEKSTSTRDGGTKTTTKRTVRNKRNLGKTRSKTVPASNFKDEQIHVTRRQQVRINNRLTYRILHPSKSEPIDYPDVDFTPGQATQGEDRLGSTNKDPSKLQLIEWHIDQELTPAQISTICGINSPQKVRKWLFRDGLLDSKYPHSKDSEKPSASQLYQWRVDEGRTVHEIASRSGYSLRAIQDRLRCLGIQGSSGAPRQYAVNEKFFRKWSPKMAWVLGLIFTDGNLPRKEASFSFAQKDILVVEQVRKVLASTHPIKKDGNTDVHNLKINSRLMRDDLEGFGLGPKKSRVIRFPVVPRAYMRDFVRGLWDGDGGFSFASNKRLMANYTCGSEEFINALADVLLDAGIGKFRFGLTRLAVHKRKNASAWDIRITHPIILERFHHYLYDLVSDEHLIKRKRDRSLEGITRNK